MGCFGYATLCYSKAAFDLDGEIDVPGCIDDVDVVVPPGGVGRGAGDGDAALAFELHRVHLGAHAILAADIVDRMHAVGVEEDPLRQGRLPTINMGGDPNVTDGFKVVDHAILPFDTHRSHPRMRWTSGQVADEMAANLDRVIYRLNQRKSYRQDFKKAYGPGPITKEKLGLALENFLLTIVSHDSKYDRVVAQKATPTKHEKRGRFLFFTPHKKGGAGCFECHGGPHFSDFEFRNNGLSLVDDLNDFGVFKVTGKEKDKLKFVTPSLRNIAITEPYMHDGRLPKLEDVVKHYNSPLYKSPTLDPKLKAEGLGLSKEDQAALVAFLKTLTDPKFKL